MSETAITVNAGAAEPECYKVPQSTLAAGEELFIREYILTGSKADAYRKVFGENERNASYKASQLLRQPKVLARLRVHQDAVSAMSVKSVATMARELEEMVEADASELVRIQIGSCRYCWGLGNEYQWRDMKEFEKALDAVSQKKPPTMYGGFGYRFSRQPNVDCPQCDGAGETRVYLTDTSMLSPGALRLYKGVELNADGTVKKLLLHDQFAARQELHRIRGMHVERSVQVNMTGRLPDANDIAKDPSKVNDFLEGLTK